VTWQRILLPSEGAKPPEEERAATLATAEGPTSYRLVGVAASDPAAGSNPSFRTMHHALRLELSPFVGRGKALKQQRHVLEVLEEIV